MNKIPEMIAKNEEIPRGCEMKGIIKIIREDEEVNQIKKEWLEISNESWMPFNYDEYSSIKEYKEKLKKRFEKIRKEKSE